MIAQEVQQEFEQVVATKLRYFQYIAWLKVRNCDDAEDIVQDALTRAYTKLNTFEGRSAMSTWIGRIVINTALMRVRRPTLEMQLLDYDLPIADPSLSAETLLIRQESEQIALNLVHTLSPALQQAVVTRYYEGLSEKAGAEKLGISPLAIKARLNRAREKLRSKFATSSNGIIQ